MKRAILAVVGGAVVGGIALAGLVAGNYFVNVFPKESLYGAACDGDVQGIRTWLARGVDPNVRVHEFDATPLSCATANGHEEAVRVLVAAGADPDRPSGQFTGPDRSPRQIGPETFAETAGGDR